MPRCGKCHSQWATYFRCPHCERRFPCPLQLFLLSLALPVVAAGGIYLLFAFSDKFKDWRASHHEQPVAKPGLTVEIDRSSVE